MKFTDMEKTNLGAANWQSGHCLSFTGVSLFHVSPLDNGDITNNLDRQLLLSFRIMRVTLIEPFSKDLIRGKKESESLGLTSILRKV